MANQWVYKDWTNFGDVSPEHEQLWVKNATVDSGENFAEVVKVFSADDFGGPDNVYIVWYGSIYIPLDDTEVVESALSTIDVTPTKATWIDKMLAFEAYAGIEIDNTTIVSLGAVTDQDGLDAMPYGWEIDFKLHGNKSITNYLREAFLN